ncbi:transposase, partial [Roseovarius sp. D22-M7]|uniref:transposase n=1 Tax=Roseovarius sp. D22-M7 TaxID=3127116 RepID=UPI0030100924
MFVVWLIPEDQRDAVAALLRETASLKKINERFEHLVAELNHVVHGKKSEKLDEERAIVRQWSEDNGERQLAFEDLQIAVSGAEEQKQDQAPGDDTPKRKRVASRNRGNLPRDLPRIEQVVEPETLVCPCGCGVVIVARTMYGWLPRGKSVSVKAGMISVAAMYTASGL